MYISSSCKLNNYNAQGNQNILCPVNMNAWNINKPVRSSLTLNSINKMTEYQNDTLNYNKLNHNNENYEQERGGSLPKKICVIEKIRSDMCLLKLMLEDNVDSDKLTILMHLFIGKNHQDIRIFKYNMSLKEYIV